MEQDEEARLDLALVRRVLLDDDRQAFAQIVRRHQGLVRALLRRLCAGDEALAEDLAQDTFLLAWRKLSSFQGESRLSTWLYRIAHNGYLQHRRRPGSRAAGVVPLDEEPEADPPAPTGSPALQLDLERALAALPEGERMVLLYHLQLGLSHEETARITGFPLGTVKTHALRGKERLRTALTAYRAGETIEPRGRT